VAIEIIKCDDAHVNWHGTVTRSVKKNIGNITSQFAQGKRRRIGERKRARARAT